MKRRIDIDSIAQKIYDLVIIGGGITGAGIFQEATLRGYQCLLIEKGDFASGTSSKSAKLIHGGIRYLKYGKLGLIKESLEERNYLLKTYPHLVKPLQFLFPIYDSPTKYRLGMAMYHFLDDQKALPNYEYLEREEVIKIFPSIDQENLRAGFIYYDAVTNDARLCNEVIHSTMQRSSSVALNYCEMKDLVVNDIESTVNCFDVLSQQAVQFKARFIVNAGGVWSDDVIEKLSKEKSSITAPSKGTHVVISQKKLPIETALVIPSYADDGRMNYALPWENETVIIGTTDTEYSGDRNSPAADANDIQYVLHSIQKFAPSLNITADDILFVYAGLRPLFKEEKSSYAKSRDYHIWWSNERLLNIYGGKLTSFHSMAQSLVEELQKKADKSVVSVRPPQKTLESLPDDLPRKFALRIKIEYSKESQHIFAIAREYESYLERLSENFEYTIAELIYFIRFQQCYHLDDLLTRRLPLTYAINGAEDKYTIIRSVAHVMRTECDWTHDEYKQEIKEYESRLHPSRQNQD